MKITRKTLRDIIKEELTKKQLQERGTGNPALDKEERALTAAVVAWVDKYRLVMGMDPNDFGDDKRVRRTLDDIIGALIE
tara:strand:- start:215 stop:454 length:240 start_codon:yes stop_codon:yes gene_type:complete